MNNVRYALVLNAFRLLQAIAVLAVLTFMLTGSRFTLIAHFGNRADVVASIVSTMAAVTLLTGLNRRVLTIIDRRFFREAYSAETIVNELIKAIPKVSTTRDLVQIVAEKLNDALHPEHVTVFLDDQTARAYVVVCRLSVESSAVVQPQDLQVPYEAPIIRNLMESGPDETVDPLFIDPDAKKLGAALLIPIASNGQLHGFMSLGRRLSDLPYAQEDRFLLITLANQVATFIENLKTLSRVAEQEKAARELNMAAEVQRHLFPATGLEDDALSVYGYCLPALGVGGDYYDYFEIDDRHIGIAIADVAGKGTSAALLMSTVQASLRCQMSSAHVALRDVAASINRVLQRSTGDNRYATLFFADFDRAMHRLTFVNAGHNPPLLIRAGGNGTEASVSLLTTGGSVIGIFLNEHYAQETIQLESGDVLIGYTDGVTEAMNIAGEEFGFDRLRAVAIESVQMSAQKITDKIVREVLNWQGQAVQHDDITLVVTRVK